MHEWREQAVVDHLATPRTEAIEQFAAVLRALRASVGSPSFRTMSGRSHAISHTTLHEAAQGNRLPSWATTAEFLKACDADPATFRERWEQAHHAIRSAVTAPDTVEIGEHDEQESEVDVREVVPSPSVQALRRHWMRPMVVRAALVALLTAASVAIGMVASRADSPRSHHEAAPGASPATQPLTPADCPVQQSNPPTVPPLDPGDAAVFIGDITLPDCTDVPRGSTVTKIWRFKNIGTVPWRGYALHRIDIPQQRNQCQTITDVPIKNTEPGQIVDIQVTITTPSTPGFCFVRFKMEDAAGHIAFPAHRPVNFQLVVD